jgi:hypothetical protein
MSMHVTDLVGYRFDPSQKSWLGAFLIGDFDEASTAESFTPPTGHYELLPLAEIQKRKNAAFALGDRDAALEYNTAETALRETSEGLRGTPNDLPPQLQANLFSPSGGQLFKVIDPKADVDWTEFGIAQKSAKVRAEFVEAGTQVDTIMANGLHETTKTAGADGGYKVTALTGEQYLVDPAKFLKIYDQTDVEGVYAPKPDPRKVLELDRNVAFQAPWGGDMRIEKGGVLVNPGGGGGIYGIQPEEYRASYSPALRPKFY